MSNETYNGWTNYETWNVQMWLSEEASCRYWEREAAKMLAVAENGEAIGRLSSAIFSLADHLESSVRDNAPDLGANCYADLLGRALGRVNWDEIARHYVEEAAERLERTR